MTKIKPLTGDINLEVRHIDGDSHALINVGPLPKPSRGGYVSEQSARHPVADILAALDAVPRAEVVNELREARAERDEATAERIKADADLAELERNFKDRLTVLTDYRHRMDEWRERAKTAEVERDALAATMERVRGVVARFLDPHGQDAVVAARVADKLRAALDPEPAFVLPTEVPARIEAKRDGKTYTFYLWTNGHGGSNDLIWVDEDDWTHSPSPERLMSTFTNHRLLGADE